MKWNFRWGSFGIRFQSLERTHFAIWCTAVKTTNNAFYYSKTPFLEITASLLWWIYLNMKCISNYMRYESTSFVSETRKSFCRYINNQVVTLQLLFFSLFCLLICGIHCPKLLWIYQEGKWKKISQGLGCSDTQTGARNPRWEHTPAKISLPSNTIFLPQVPAIV